MALASRQGVGTHPVEFLALYQSGFGRGHQAPVLAHRRRRHRIGADGSPIAAGLAAAHAIGHRHRGLVAAAFVHRPRRVAATKNLGVENPGP